MRETSGAETGGRSLFRGAVVVLDVHPASTTPARATVIARRRGQGEGGKGKVYPLPPLASEVERQRDLRQARHNDVLRRQPGGVGRARCRNRVGVEHVEEIEADDSATLTE